MTKVVHDTDLGAGLEVAGGKVNVADSQATDVELSDAIAENNITDATEERQILDNIRYQDGILFTAPWELDGLKVKAYTGTSGVTQRFLSIHTTGGYLSFMFPAAGSTVKGLGGLADLTVDAQGFVTLPNWGALWYKWSGADLGWYYSTYTVGYDATVEYIRVVGLGSDNGHVGHLADGTVINQGMNYPDRVTSVAGKRPAPYRRYVRNLGVFEGFIENFGLQEGDYNASVVHPSSVRTDAVVHYRLPLNTTTLTAQMYRLHFTGHQYQAAKKIIDTTVCGYPYPSGLHHPEVIGTHAAETTQYIGSDGHVYIRVAWGDVYFHTLSIDSMGVGNGFPLKHGSIQAIINPAATL